MRTILILVVLAFAASACVSAGDATKQSGPPSAGELPQPILGATPDAADPGGPLVGADGLVADLIAQGLTVEAAGSFTTRFLGGSGHRYCVDGQQVSVWEYPSQADRESASRLIDSDDPSNIGNASVVWRGDPTFWQRDTTIVLYLGKEAAILDVLNKLLGPAFAEGRGRSSRNAADCVVARQTTEPEDPPQEISRFSLFYSHGGGAVYTEGSATEWDLVSSSATVTIGATLLPTDGEELQFIALEPGTYTIRSWQRPCPGSCGDILEPPTAVCAARFTLAPGATVEAYVTVSPGQGSCSFKFLGTEDTVATDPGDYRDLPITYPVTGSN